LGGGTRNDTNEKTARDIVSAIAMAGPAFKAARIPAIGALRRD
jgi:hypothetical protein